MKTKLLIKLRRDADERVGVFYDKNINKFSVILDSHIIPDLSYYEKDKTENEYRTLYTTESLDEAKHICDHYKREVILLQARQKKYKNKNRVY